MIVGMEEGDEDLSGGEFAGRMAALWPEALHNLTGADANTGTAADAMDYGSNNLENED